MTIEANIRKILDEIPPSVQLVVVSKTQPVETILEAYRNGQRIFGENRVQELLSKQNSLPADIKWHLIGHLQTNKVRSIAPFVSLIHSVDSLKLLKEINRQAEKENRKIDCLLQVYIASEETKFGLNKAEVLTLLHDKEFASLQNIRIRGLMGMATYTENKEQIRSEFKSLKIFFNELKQSRLYSASPNVNHFFDILSMGMSSDYRIAIEEGSTMIRLGSSIFYYGNHRYEPQS